MSNYFNDIGLSGFAHWTKIQAKEELDHAILIFDYLKERNEKVTFDKIEVPDEIFDNPLDVMETILAHEIYITRMISHIVEVSQEEKDFATHSFFRWFVDEQVEEENNVINIISKLKMIEDNKSALYMLDKDLSQRIYQQPV